jgi:hypothetical protein
MAQCLRLFLLCALSIAPRTENSSGDILGLAEKYISEIPELFDLASILEPDVEKIENIKYGADVIYKYFPSARSGFFSRPQLRFSQKEALNDPSR